MCVSVAGLFSPGDVLAMNALHVGYRYNRIQCKYDHAEVDFEDI